MGPHPLVLTEWLCEAMNLTSGSRVLDLGCGKAISSAFLAKEYSVQVWATDLWKPATENLQRIRELELERDVFPIRADARALPFADQFFDAIVCVDSYFYFGTDETYLRYLSRFLKPRGEVGIVVPGLMHDFPASIPEHLSQPQSHGTPFWTADGDCWHFHSIDWWRHLLLQRGIVDLDVADSLSDGWRIWAQHERALELLRLTGLVEDGFPSDAEALEHDRGAFLGFLRFVGRLADCSPTTV